MPNHEDHCRHSEQRYGVRGDDIHSWMDELSFTLGRSHRDFRHNPNRDLPMVIRTFGGKYGDDVAREIFLDHITLDNKERARSKAESFQPNEHDEPSDPTPIRIPTSPPSRPLTHRDVYLFIGIFGAILAVFSFIGVFPLNFIENIEWGIVGIVIVLVVVVVHSIDKNRK
jgi:ABC-type multidrug transport system fused ATPase/permease subunit